VLSAFARAFTTPELRNKLLFTLAIIVIYRLGTFIPAPGVDYGNVQQCLAMGNTTGGAYDLVNLFSGGALLQLSIFALGVMPYITASIIVQLLRVVIPRFQELHDEGAQGQTKLTQYTRYLTIGLAALNATTVVSLARSGSLLGNCPLPVIPDDHHHDHHHDGRHHRDHVAGGAHHGPRRGQRHVAADLHLHRGHVPRGSRGHP